MSGTSDLHSTALRLAPSRIAEFFRYRCERQLRYELVPAAARGEAGVPDARTGAGAALLMGAGRAWERRKVRQLIARFGAERVRVAGWTLGDNPRRLPYEEVVAALRAPGPLQVLVQPELRLPDPVGFARRFGLDPERVQFTPAVPDLIRIRTLRDGRRLFQVVDLKASAGARVSHFAQVAFYALVLEEVCAAEGIGTGEPDLRWGRIWARDGRGPRRFALAAYRHHVAKLLREEVARVVEQRPEESAWHVAARCGGCGYLVHCRRQADATDDLARVVGITPTARGVLNRRGIRTARQLAESMGRDTYQGCHALESQPERLKKRAQAVRFNKLFEIETRTHLMPAREDVRVLLSAEGDPVSGLCFGLGIRVEGTLPGESLPAASAWIAAAGTRAEERRILEPLLDRVDAVLRAAAEGGAGTRGRGGRSVHFFVADRAELEQMRALLLRHLPDRQVRPAIARLLRVLSPRALTARPDVVRSSPGTLLDEVVAALFALPVPYSYDLPAVSDRLRPARDPFVFAPPLGYASPFSSQISFERVHEMWRRRTLGADPEPVDPEEATGRLRTLVLEKLAAMDSVVRAVRERTARREGLQMRKEPFALEPDDGPIDDPMLEELRVFAELESAAEAVSTRALHLLPAAERARRFECIRGLHLVQRRDDGCLVFEFDPACRDAKFRPGDFNLLLTNDDDRSLQETDRQPWRRRRLTVELVEYDLAGPFPTVLLAPTGDLARAEAERWIDLDRVCVLDRAPADFSTSRILATLRAVAAGHGEAAAVLSLLRGETPSGWRPGFGEPARAAALALAPASAAYGRPVLNPDQRRAWAAAFRRPLSLVWGPPGTGKTYLLAWMLIGLAAAARAAGRPCRILVTAATHRAIVNVLARLDAELRASGVDAGVRAVKLRNSGNESDRELEGGAVEVVPDTRLSALLREAETGGPLVVGSTVWSLWKRMRAEGEGGEAEAVPVRSWFDVVVVDEASQIKVSEALIGLSSLRPGGSVILCGDDRQLSPVVRGRYDPESGTLYGSAFSHLAAHFPRLALRESRRMNAALVEYPREVFYPGLVSMTPERRVSMAPPEGLSGEDRLLHELFLAPDDAVVLCTYRDVRATARNAFEARLAARLAWLARAALRHPATGAPFTAPEFVAEALAVLSPHRAQNGAITAELRALGQDDDEMPVVDTVERMQGNERDLIIVSYAVADREYAEAEAEFLLNPNRFNVAITRARAKLIVLLSEAVLDAVSADEEVLAGSMALKGYVEHCRDAVREAVLTGADGQPVAVRCHYRRILSAPVPHPPSPVPVP